MMENDFPAFRAAVRDSIIGDTVTVMTTSLTNAVANASVTRMIRSQAAIFQCSNGADAIRLGAIALTSAGVATWVVSPFVRLYVSTAIPRSTFLVLAVIGAAAAGSAHFIAAQWSRSRIRRVTRWLRGA